ncbi:hypothetical protein M8494_18955 [Serratia ureilytica]
MSMSDEFYDKYLPGLVKDGLVAESDIDRASPRRAEHRTTWGCSPIRMCIWARRVPIRRTPTPKAACTAPRRGWWRAKRWCC